MQNTGTLREMKRSGFARSKGQRRRDKHIRAVRSIRKKYTRAPAREAAAP
jgi:ribosomal protein S21